MWLPTSSTYKVQSAIQGLPGNAKVASLINSTEREWKMELVREVFGEEEAETIQKIPISSTGVEDRLIWQGIKDEGFIVKSAYYLQNELNAMMLGQSSLVTKKTTDWTSCWRRKIPNAVKTFIWRACLDSLPTRLNLVKKRICKSPKCHVCLCADETVIHILWNCPFAMDVWSHGSSSLQKCSIRPETFSDLVEALNSSYDIEINSFLEFKNAQQKPQASPCGTTEGLGTWNPPLPGVIKVNWDASLSASNGRAGFGIVAREHQGRILAHKKFSKPSSFDPLLAEAQRALYAVELAIELGYSSIILERDSHSIIKGVMQDQSRWDRVGMILSDTKMKLSYLVSWNATFVKGNCNTYAHTLAKVALSLLESLVDLVVNPDTL
ncbi:uncharacterized protein LOC122301836 [Carya illinoinensis]|uniref:uncharacterized protein LOC122301836 n=1 Tax=Carya illinoinensis TaxID=32201 RepID=UPI001C721261|nr:uncharacterized protein LOC122301836 [Carya illinoinensis]